MNVESRPPEVGQVVRVLQALTGSTLKLDKQKHCWHAHCDLCPLVRRYDGLSRVIIPTKSAEDGAVAEVESLLPRRDNALALVFHIYPEDRIPGNQRRTLHLSQKELQTLAGIAAAPLALRRPRFALFVAERQSVLGISPYQIDRPARRRMFIDRVDQIDQLLEFQNFKAILGPRRIGKTSLAYEVLRRVAEDRSRYVRVSHDPAPVLPAVLMPCLGVEIERFWEEIYDRIGASEKTRAEGRLHMLIDFTKRKYRRLDDYESFLRLTSLEYRRPFAILDEIDGLIAKDEGSDWEFFRQLKGWALSVDATVIFVGYRKLFEALQDDEFPFYETCDELTLSVLSFEDTVRLIREPLQEMGFDTPKEVSLAAACLSGGAPALAHGLADELLKIVKSPRKIELADLRAAAAQSRTLKTSYRNFRSEAGPFERLVVLLYLRKRFAKILNRLQGKGPAEDPEAVVFELALELGEAVTKEKIRANDLQALLRSQLGDLADSAGFSRRFRSALDELSLRNVLQQRSPYNQYSFVSPYFLARVLVETAGKSLEFEIREAQHEAIGFSG